jgi:hypothetical protein
MTKRTARTRTFLHPWAREDKGQRAEVGRGSARRLVVVAETIGGSCLCGGVRFEVTLPFTRAVHCHCSRCRKHSGAFGLTVGHIPRDRVRVLQGEELIRVYRPDGGRVKAFCSQCGSSLFGAEWPEGEMASVRLGALDGDPEVRPEWHSYVDSRAPWDELPDDRLPRYPDAPPP